MSFVYDQEKMAKASGKFLPISYKQSVVICDFVRGKNVQKIKRALNNVLGMQQAVPFTRFSHGAGHKPGIGPGKYPIKAVTHFITLIESAEANAQNKGLAAANLCIVHAMANNAGNSWHYGRQRRRRRKISHVELIVAEKAPVEKKNAKKAPGKETPAAKKQPQSPKKGPEADKK